MNLKSQPPAPIDKRLMLILDKIKEVAAPDRVILFGSRARDTHQEDSDYDLLVVKSGNYSRRRLAIKLHQSFVDVPGPVDVLVATPEMLEKYKDTPALIYSDILKNGVEVYAA